ncbi:MAG TPA: sugar phosphate isomerase/epimerase [Thermoguttaceae bacterium]|nr:sugar phosphate isomerase/epimerase [Thermoguttaceae bacterium]
MQTASAVVACAGAGRATFGAAPAAAAETPGAADEPLAARLGIASYTFRLFNLDATLAMTKRLGVKYLCLKSSHLPLNAKPEAIRAAVEKIKKQGLVFYGAGAIAMQNQAQIDEAFEYARQAGLKIMVIAPTAKTLPEIERKVKQYDVRVAIHNHGPGDRHFPTPESVYEKIKNMDPRMGLCVDVGHTVRQGDDVYAALEACRDRIYDVHMKDVTAANVQGQTTVLGRGVMDMPRLFRTIQKIRYSGVLAFEYESEGRDPLPSVAQSVGYARGMLAALNA